MSLIDDLRNRRVEPPTSKEFDLKKWLEYGAEPDSPEVASLVAAGIVFKGSLDSLRGELRYVSRKELSGRYKRRELIAVANRECLLAEVLSYTKASDLVADGGLSPERISSIKIDLPGGGFAADEIAQTVVDSAGRLLEMCKDKGSAGSDMEFGAPSDELINDFKIGAAYVIVEDLWQDVVWSGFRPRLGNPLSFLPSDAKEDASRVIERFRHINTTTQANIIRTQILREEVRKRGRDSGGVYKLLSAVPDNNAFDVMVVDCDATTYANNEALISVSIPEYYKNLCVDRSLLFPLLSLENVIRAFFALRHLAKDLSKLPVAALQAEVAGVGPILADIVVLAPAVRRAALVSALALAISVSDDEALAIVNFLTFGSEPDRSGHKLSPELWSSPLVSVAPDEITVSLFPLLHVNLRWLVDVWLKRLGHDLSLRGTEFEVFAIKEIAESVSGSEVSSVVQVCLSGFLFSPRESRDEQIDLVMLFGSTVLIAELKCYLEPITPIDHHNYKEKLIEAAAQVKRKAQSVESYREEFIKRARKYNLVVPPEFKVEAAVVLNHAIGAGRVVDDIPIVDLRIVEMFLENRLAWGVTLSSDGSTSSAEVQSFYGSAEDVASSLRGYLHNPPQLAHLRGALKLRTTGVLMPAASGQHVLKVQLEVDPSKLSTPSGGRPISSD